MMYINQSCSFILVRFLLSQSTKNIFCNVYISLQSKNTVVKISIAKVRHDHKERNSAHITT